MSNDSSPNKIEQLLIPQKAVLRADELEAYVRSLKAQWRTRAQSKTWEEKVAAIERMRERDAAIRRARELNLAQQKALDSQS
jgi:hypothetical protein